MTKQHSKTQSQASRRTGAKVRGLPARLLNLALACVMAVTMIPALSLSADPPSRPDVIDVLINSGPGSALLGSDVNDLLDPAIRAEFERVLFELHKGNDLTDFPSPSALFTTLTPLPCVNAGCTPTTVAPACRAAINALIPTVQVRQPRPVDIRANDLRDWIVYTRFDGSVINSWTAA
ncbi:MAG: hypothetical protein FWE68_04530, partial [Defluviitaleaceae bacterium]|nr:hypothetical protein [Defluviitaleaceae bacterium]